MREDKYAHWHNDNYPPPNDKWMTMLGIALIFITILLVLALR
jgi:hypothetical protein